MLRGAYFIGDSLKDLQAATAFAMRPILVRTGKGLGTENELADNQMADVPVYDNLLAAVTSLVVPEPH